jgi:hypothetical protein
MNDVSMVGTGLRFALAAPSVRLCAVSSTAGASLAAGHHDWSVDQ